MKTQLIHLEQHDDVISVRDKMSWAKTERILLVIPPRSHLHSRTLDLRLLKRHAVSLGAQLAIVTRGDELRRIAKEQGIPAFSKLSNAKKRQWQAGVLPPKEYRRTPPPDLRRMRREIQPPSTGWWDRYNYRLLFFTLPVLAILAVLLLFVPSASIQLSPATRFQSLTFAASAGVDVTAVNPLGSLPARSTSVIVERTKTVPATGSVAIPFARAAGLVRFRNLTTAPLGIPAGTVVSTQAGLPVRFVTTAAADLAAGAGKMVDVPVQAVAAGSAGNLPADALVAMESDLGASLAVTNPKPMAGGSDRKAAIPTAADRTSLRAALVAQILAECKTSLLQTLMSGDVFFPGALTVSQTLTETYFPAEGQAGDTLSLSLRLQCQAQYASSADVNTLAEILLNADSPQGYAPVSGGLVIQPASVPLTDTKGITHWYVQAQSLLQARVDPLTVVQISLGHRPSVVVKLLKRSLPLAASPVIHIKPAWWPWLPVIPFNIKVSSGS